MLGCVLRGQPPVIFRVSENFSANAGICARLTTDRDLVSVNAIKKVNACKCAPRTTDIDPAHVIPDRKEKSLI